MRPALIAAAAALGAAVGLLGSRPLWVPAVIALIAFPLAAAAGARDPRRRAPGSLVALIVAGVAGGLLTALAIRLAVDAPGWFNGGAVDCGGASDTAQQSVLAAAAALFAAAGVAIAVNLLAVARRAGSGERSAPAALALYPVAVAASGLALIASSYVTSC